MDTIVQLATSYGHGELVEAAQAEVHRNLTFVKVLCALMSKR